MGIQEPASANERVDSDQDFSVEGAVGGNLSASADVLGTPMEAGDNKGQQADKGRPEDHKVM